MTAARTSRTGSIFTIKSGNEWMRAAAKGRRPGMLLGEFWLEGELAILFGEAGAGTSMLAVQVAESIARGKSIGELKNQVRPQRTVYIDFAMSGEQFALRYRIPDPEDQIPDQRTKKLKGRKSIDYKFSENFRRVGVDLTAELEKGKSIGESINDAIKDVVGETGARVLVVDDLTYLQRSNYGTGEAAAVMSCLRGLKEKFGLSILVCVHAGRRAMERPLSVGDLGSLRFLANSADNIFAIGHSRGQANLRYLKQIKPRNTELVYSDDHVPVFRIARIGGNFLGFEFEEFTAEADHLKPAPRNSEEMKLIGEMKQMADTGRTQREIAEAFGTSKTRVNRLLKMWRPGSYQKAVEPAAPVFYGLEKCIVDRCKEAACGMCRGRSGHRFHDLSQEKVLGHKNCPDFCSVCGPRAYSADSDVDEQIKAASDAFYEELREWLIGGKREKRPRYRRPVPVTDDERVAHKKQILEQTLERRRWTHNYLLSLGHDGDPAYIEAYEELYGESMYGKEAPGEPPPAEPDDENTIVRYTGPDTDPDIVRRRGDRMAGLKRSLDAYGKEFFIEQETESGELKVWYRYDSKGRIQRWIKIGNGHHGDGTFHKLPPIDAPTMGNGMLCKEIKDGAYVYVFQSQGDGR